MWLFHFLMKKSTSSALRERLASKCNSKTRVTSTAKTITVASYPYAVNYFLRTKATDNYIADTEDEITTFTQPPNEIPSQFKLELVAKTLCCEHNYKGQDRKEIFTKRLDKSIR